MNEPTVTLALDLDRMSVLREGDKPIRFLRGYATVYIVTDTEDGQIINVVLVRADHFDIVPRTQAKP